MYTDPIGGENGLWPLRCPQRNLGFLYLVWYFRCSMPLTVTLLNSKDCHLNKEKRLHFAVLKWIPIFYLILFWWNCEVVSLNMSRFHKIRTIGHFLYSIWVISLIFSWIVAIENASNHTSLLTILNCPKLPIQCNNTKFLYRKCQKIQPDKLECKQKKEDKIQLKQAQMCAEGCEGGCLLVHFCVCCC